MASRVMKKVDYLELVLLVWKHAGYNPAKADVLYEYVSGELLKSGYNTIYIEKMRLDLLLVTDNTGSAGRVIPQQAKLSKYFNFYEEVEIKSLVFDILHKGYYE